MRYSLINVVDERPGEVDGYWLQDYHGTLDGAVERAKATNEKNSNRLNIAVCEPPTSPVPGLEYHQGLKRYA